MKLRFSKISLRLLALSFFSSASLANSQDEHDILISRRTSIDCQIQWIGQASQTYFLQSSSDLVNWNYVPVIDFGSGSHQHVIPTVSPQFFMRLRYLNDPSINSLAEAQAADFDHDGISNLAELTSTDPTDPFDSEDPGGDDDLLNTFEHLIGSNPLVSYTLETMDTSLEIFLPSE